MIKKKRGEMLSILKNYFLGTTGLFPMITLHFAKYYIFTKKIRNLGGMEQRFLLNQAYIVYQ